MAELSDHNDEAITVTVQTNGATTVVRVTGEIDIDTSPTLRAAVTPLFERPLPHTVIFDLGAVSFVDSAGLTVFISVARDGRIVFSGTHPRSSPASSTRPACQTSSPSSPDPHRLSAYTVRQPSVSHRGSGPDSPAGGGPA
jgi:anti-anti-sigma factor